MYTHTPGFVFTRYRMGKSGLTVEDWEGERRGVCLCYTVDERNFGRTDERTNKRASHLRTPIYTRARRT